MKLAEALILRADLQKRIEQLKQRINNNARVQEGEPPAEDPNQLLVEMDQLHEQLLTLIQRINRTNFSVMLDDRLSIADALAVRDSLQAKHKAHREFAQTTVIGTSRQMRVTRSEIRLVPMMDARQLQVDADRLAREHRELDTKIQGANWTVDLL